MSRAARTAALGAALVLLAASSADARRRRRERPPPPPVDLQSVSAIHVARLGVIVRHNRAPAVESLRTEDDTSFGLRLRFGAPVIETRHGSLLGAELDLELGYQLLPEVAPGDFDRTDRDGVDQHVSTSQYDLAPALSLALWTGDSSRLLLLGGVRVANSYRWWGDARHVDGMLGARWLYGAPGGLFELDLEYRYLPTVRTEPHVFQVQGAPSHISHRIEASIASRGELALGAGILYEVGLNAFFDGTLVIDHMAGTFVELRL